MSSVFKYVDQSLFYNVFVFKYVDGSLFYNVSVFKYVDWSLFYNVFVFKYVDWSLFYNVFVFKCVDGSLFYNVSVFEYLLQVGACLSPPFQIHAPLYWVKCTSAIVCNIGGRPQTKIVHLMLFATTQIHLLPPPTTIMHSTILLLAIMQIQLRSSAAFLAYLARKY